MYTSQNLEVWLSGESARVEYKEKLPQNSEKWMKTVIGFSNGGGGRIFAC